jgi:hypothetical protein
LLSDSTINVHCICCRGNNGHSCQVPS